MFSGAPVFILFCGSFFQTNEVLGATILLDTLPKNQEKTVVKTSYNSETNQYVVRYTDGTSESMDRSKLEEWKIYFPGLPKRADTVAIHNEQKNASVDTTLWLDHLKKYLPEYVSFASRKGLRRGSYEVKVRFIVDENGMLENFSAIPNPGYRFVEFMEAIFKNGPKWAPAEQDGKKIKSYHIQPISFRITYHLDAQ